MTGSHEPAPVVGSPEWGTQVLEALKTYFEDDGYLLEPARLIDAQLEADSDGTPVLLATYKHPYYERTIGLRRRLDRWPTASTSDESPATSLAAEIAVYEISEPLGRVYEQLVEDGSGVWWWGDGYPTLSEQM